MHHFHEVLSVECFTCPVPVPSARLPLCTSHTPLQPTAAMFSLPEHPDLPFPSRSNFLHLIGSQAHIRDAILNGVHALAFVAHQISLRYVDLRARHGRG